MSAICTSAVLRRVAPAALLLGCGATNDQGRPTTTVASGPSPGTTSSTAMASTTAGPTVPDGDAAATPADGSSTRGTFFDLGDAPDLGDVAEPTEPQLWYAVSDRLVYIEIDPTDGSVALLVSHQIVSDAELPGQGSGITMLEDGGLLIVRGPGANGSGDYFDEPSSIYYAASPPTTIAGEVEFELLGQMPDNVAVEGMHVDCEGLVYLMDSGTNSASADGNRLLRFTGEFLGGDLSYEVITDLSTASVADIDDMAPGIDAMGEITDSRGFAIDSGTVHDFDYLAGTGTALGMAGTFGIHALGGALFDDDIARLYVLDRDAQLFEVDPVTLDSSDVLVTGPDIPNQMSNGTAGLAGPLTACETGFPPQ